MKRSGLIILVTVSLILIPLLVIYYYMVGNANTFNVMTALAPFQRELSLGEVTSKIGENCIVVPVASIVNLSLVDYSHFYVKTGENFIYSPATGYASSSSGSVVALAFLNTVEESPDNVCPVVVVKHFSGNKFLFYQINDKQIKSLKIKEFPRPMP